MLICVYFRVFLNSSTSRFLEQLQFILKKPTSLLHFASCFVQYSCIALGTEGLYPILFLLGTVQFKLSGAFLVSLNLLLCPWLSSRDCITIKYSPQAMCSLTAWSTWYAVIEELLPNLLTLRVSWSLPTVASVCSFSARTVITQEVHPLVPGSPPASGDSLWKGGTALPHGQLPAGWLGAFAAQGGRRRQQVTAW